MNVDDLWLVLYLLMLAVMAAVAARAYAAWRGVGSLPTQWGPDGEPTWFARTALAVSAAPLLAVVTTNLELVSGSLRLPDHVRVALCVVFLVVQAIHLVLVKGWIDKQGLRH